MPSNKKSAAAVTKSPSVGSAIKKSTSVKSRTGKKKGVERETFRLECVVDSKVVLGETRYLVKWENYSHEQNTWEPIDNLRGCEAHIEEYTRRKSCTSTEISTAKFIGGVLNYRVRLHEVPEEEVYRTSSWMREHNPLELIDYLESCIEVEDPVAEAESDDF